MGGGLLKSLPSPSPHLQGWPWNEETDPKGYDPSRQYPKISIITPSFNQGKFIEATIRSVLLQNYPNLEYIIIDGGSNDESLAIIEKYARWIDYWVSESDRGQTHAINKGFQRSKGEIGNWINSDDLLGPQSLLQVAHFFDEHPEVDFVNGRMNLLTADGLKLADWNSPFNKINCIADFCYFQPSCFFRTNIFEQIGYLDEAFEITMDWDFYIKIALTKQMRDWPVVLSYFRKHTNQKTHQYSNLWHQNLIVVFSKLLRTFDLNQQYSKSLKAIHLYMEGVQKYPQEHDYSSEEVNKALGIFLLNLARRNYGIQKFERCFQITEWVKSHLPSQYSSDMERLDRRSRLYRNPLLGQLKKYYHKLIRHS